MMTAKISFMLKYPIFRNWKILTVIFQNIVSVFLLYVIHHINAALEKKRLLK